MAILGFPPDGQNYLTRFSPDDALSPSDLLSSAKTTLIKIAVIFSISNTNANTFLMIYITLEI